MAKATRHEGFAQIAEEARKAVREHAGDPTTKEGFSQLPPNIANGIARLSGAEIIKIKNGQNAGKSMLRLEGKIVRPRMVMYQGSPVVTAGETTTLMLNLFPTQDKDGKEVSFSEAIGKALNEVRKLGLDTSEHADTPLPDMLDMLLEEKPYFKFSTRGSEEVKNADGTVKYAARTWESWKGSEGLEDFDEDMSEGATRDNTAAESAVANSKPAASKPSVKIAADTVPDDESFDLAQDIDSLAEKADNENNEYSDNVAEKAAERLTEMAKEAGISLKEIKQVSSWAALVELYRERTGTGEEETPTTTYAEGESVMVRLRDPRTKKVGNPLSAKILHCYEDTETVDVKIGKDIHKAVPFAQVSPKGG